MDDRITKVRDLSRIPYGGVEDSVVHAWLDELLSNAGSRDSEFEPALTELQAIVANTPSAFQTPGRNLLVCGPTSAGKTLVAEMLIANHLAKVRPPLGCVYLVPLRALATEKWERFRRVFGVSGVYPSSSDYQRYDGFILNRNFRIAVVVYEKFLRWLLTEESQKKILRRTGLIIVDELQMIADIQRGSKLELLLTLIRDYQRSHELTPGEYPLRVIGLGPSQDALRKVGDWLECLDLSLPDDAQRPIPLVEGFVNRDGIPHHRPLDARLQSAMGDSYPLPAARGSLHDMIDIAVGELLDAKKRMLVYCATKESAENVARQIATRLGTRQELNTQVVERLEALEPTAALTILNQTLPARVAFHHGDLTLGERALVEQLFRAGTEENHVDVVVCTPTLGMGVNLPADVVLFTTDQTFRPAEYYFRGVNPAQLSPLEYRNFAGRAGRFMANPPTNYHGLSLFLSQLDVESAKRELVHGLMEQPIAPVESALARGAFGLEPIALATLQWDSIMFQSDRTSNVVRRLFTTTLAHEQGVRVRAPIDLGEIVEESSETLDAADNLAQVAASENRTHSLERRPVASVAVNLLVELSTREGKLVKHSKEGNIDVFDLKEPGAIVASMGINVRTYAILTAALAEMPEILESPLALLERLVQAPEVTRLYPTRLPEGSDAAKVTRALLKFFRTQRDAGAVLGPIAQGFVDEPSVGSREHRACLTRTAAAWYWMQGIAWDEVMESGMFPDLRYGAIATLTDQLSWFVDSLLRLWHVLQIDVDDSILAVEDEILLDITYFMRRLRYGVPPGLETVAHLNVRGWHRQRLVELWKTIGGWDHPVRLLRYTGDALPVELRPLLVALQTHIREVEWSDDPRAPAERQSDAMRHAIELRGLEVDDAWPEIVYQLYTHDGDALKHLIARSLQLAPLSWSVVEGSDDKGEASLFITTSAGLMIGLQIVPSEDNDTPIDAAKIAQFRGRYGPEGSALTKLVLLTESPVGDLPASLLKEQSYLILQREAFVELISKDALGSMIEDPDDPSRRGVSTLEQILVGTSGVLRGAGDVHIALSSPKSPVHDELSKRGAIGTAGLASLSLPFDKGLRSKALLELRLKEVRELLSSSRSIFDDQEQWRIEQALDQAFNEPEAVIQWTATFGEALVKNTHRRWATDKREKPLAPKDMVSVLLSEGAISGPTALNGRWLLEIRNTIKHAQDQDGKWRPMEADEHAVILALENLANFAHGVLRLGSKSSVS